eukprot:3970559-Alexandrium_andersonii.AAC.1
MCIRDSQSATRQSAIRAGPVYWRVRTKDVKSKGPHELCDRRLRIQGTGCLTVFRLSCCFP